MTRRDRHPRRAARPAAGTAAMAAAGFVVLLLTTACGADGEAALGGPPDSGKPLHRPANFDPSIPGYVACSDKVLEGDVVRVVDERPGRMLVSLTVDHWVKPSSGPAHVRLSLVDIAKEGAYHRWSPGTHLRLVTDVDPSSLPDWNFSAHEFRVLEQAVPQAARLTCPYGPR